MVLPGLFSTMTGCPQWSCSSFPISRPEMSSGPPGGNGTTSLTGLEGKSCAAALQASTSTHRTAAVVRLMIPPRRETIRPSPHWGLNVATRAEVDRAAALADPEVRERFKGIGVDPDIGRTALNSRARSAGSTVNLEETKE